MGDNLAVLYKTVIIYIDVETLNLLKQSTSGLGRPVASGIMIIWSNDELRLKTIAFESLY